jgi:hypothetical protein
METKEIIGMLIGIVIVGLWILIWEFFVDGFIEYIGGWFPALLTIVGGGGLLGKWIEDYL